MFLQEAYAEGEPVSTVIHPDFRKLENYDRDNGSELAPTLCAYLKSNRNISEMAKLLHISKSAGFYRINQIRDLLDNPFSDRIRMICYECSEMLMEM
ncbi:MAG: helix-turn-helix domain-containing protein [Clostridiales bacterium]|nr:helix-turn-helix domain-containing protein [Clostridiales bacterium]